MRRLSVVLAVVGALYAGRAQAQFANQSVLLSAGYMSLGDPSVSGGVPISLGYTRYLDSGLEFTSRLSFMILALKGSSYLVIGGELAPGIRYLFLQEELRPYVGLELSFRYINGVDTSQTSSGFFGVGPVVGLDYFLTDQFSLGVRGQFDVYMMLNQRIQVGGGGAVVAAAYF